MWYMDILIFKNAFDDRNSNNTTSIPFSIYCPVINIEESDWIIGKTFLLSVESPRSSATILKRYSEIILSKTGKASQCNQVKLSPSLVKNSELLWKCTLNAVATTIQLKNLKYHYPFILACSGRKSIRCWKRNEN